MKEVIKNSLISIVTLIVSLLIIEGVFKFFIPQELSWSWRTISEHGYLLNKANWESTHRFNGVKAKYRFNEFHMRGDDVDFANKNILVLGDSYSFGGLLEEDSSFVGQLQNSIQTTFPEEKIKLLNASAGGWGLADQLDYLREFGEKIKPEYIFLFFNFTSIENSQTRKKFVGSAGLLSSLKVLLNDSKIYQWFLENSHLVQWVRNQLIKSSLSGDEPNMLGNSILENENTNIKGIELGNQLFTEIDQECNKIESKLVVIVPGFNWKGKTMADAEFAFLSQASDFFSDLNVAFYNLEDCVNNNINQENDQEFLIPEEYHPNAKGSRIISKCAFNELMPVLNSL